MSDETKLVEQLARRDPDALGRIYRQHKDSLLAFGIACCNDRSLVEDALQDVFVTLARKTGHIRFRLSIKAYLSASLINRIRNLVRKRKNFKAVLPKLDPDSFESGSPNHAILTKEQCDHIGLALTKLPAEQRETILLHLYAGLTFQEIADANELSINTVQSRYRYGLTKLRDLLC